MKGGLFIASCALALALSGVECFAPSIHTVAAHRRRHAGSFSSFGAWRDDARRVVARRSTPEDDAPPDAPTLTAAEIEVRNRERKMLEKERDKQSQAKYYAQSDEISAMQARIAARAEELEMELDPMGQGESGEITPEGLQELTEARLADEKAKGPPPLISWERSEDPYGSNFTWYEAIADELPRLTYPGPLELARTTAVVFLIIIVMAVYVINLDKFIVFAFDWKFHYDDYDIEKFEAAFKASQAASTTLGGTPPLP